MPIILTKKSFATPENIIKTIKNKQDLFVSIHKNILQHF